MISVFDLITDGEDEYIEKIKSFNPVSLSDEFQDLISNYKSPSRSYIKASARGVVENKIKVQTLQYIIENCYECSSLEKYQAIIIVLYKLFQQKNNVQIVDDAKLELLKILQKPKEKQVNDLSYLDNLVESYKSNFVYVTEISIGSNKILKYGITDKLPRKRFTQIKIDIQQNYTNHCVVIKPQVIVYSKHNKEIEDDIKVLLAENNIIKTGYTFKGSTETIHCKYYKKLYEILQDTLSNYPDNICLYNKMEE